MAPHLAPTADDPIGLPQEAFDGIVGGLLANVRVLQGLAMQSTAQPSDVNVPQGVLDEFWREAMQSGLKSSYECIVSLGESDFTDDLKRFDVPTLLIHGDDDQVVPVSNSERSARLIPNAKDTYYPGAPHGLTTTHQDQVNNDLLTFLQS